MISIFRRLLVAENNVREKFNSAKYTLFVHAEVESDKNQRLIHVELWEE